MFRVTSRPATGRPRGTPPASSTPRPDTAARPGRRRSEQSRLAILAAAYQLVGEIGYARLTIEGIAARSGTGKQTIYRWWPSKGDVVLDALATMADLHVPIPEEGSYAADLRAFLLASFALGRQSQLIEVLRALMAQAQIDPEFWRRFRNAFLQRRRDALGIIVDRAQARGDLPSGVSPGTVADIVFGVIWYRILATRVLPDSRLADELVTALAGRPPAPEPPGRVRPDQPSAGPPASPPAPARPRTKEADMTEAPTIFITGATDGLGRASPAGSQPTA
jgi:AcrR family transcriptional regulator